MKQQNPKWRRENARVEKNHNFLADQHQTTVSDTKNSYVSGENLDQMLSEILLMSPGEESSDRKCRPEK